MSDIEYRPILAPIDLQPPVCEALISAAALGQNAVISTNILELL
jgi:hypothetical protein